jgi:hypothetical protein
MKRHLMTYKQRHVMVRLAPLMALLEWCEDSSDFRDEADGTAMRAYHALARDIAWQPAKYGCKHAQETGFLCHECKKFV